MKTAVIAVTKNGVELAGKIAWDLGADIYVKNDYIDKIILNGELVMIHPFTADFGGMVEKIFHTYDALIFITACGIAVRSIAPYIKDKQSDPAVVVVDELGRFAISLLSGHIGGANRLAGKVAAIVGGIPIISTSTDINGVIAFDVLAVDNDCAIENIGDLKYISSELVHGGKVSFFSDCKTVGALPHNIEKYVAGQICKLAVALTNSTKAHVKAEKVLYLRPRNLILGIGCKKGKTKQEIDEAIMSFLEVNNKSVLSIKSMASIQLKAKEKGILDFCSERKLPFKTFLAEEIKAVEHQFPSSAFVKRTTGVGCVSEASAMLAGINPRLICAKTVFNGITLALAEEEKVFTL